MTQEEKELLLKDLCARLPYKVAVELDEKFGFNKGTRVLVKELLDLYCVEGMKPYLRPMSSMTEEECEELSRLMPYDEVEAWKYIKTPVPLVIANPMQFDFFHSHHLDWRGLISKGLAIEVTEENNPYREQHS